MDITIPDLPESHVRMTCLTLAHEHADDPDLAMAIAASYVEFVENGCSGLCPGCVDELNNND